MNTIHFQGQRQFMLAKTKLIEHLQIIVFPQSMPKSVMFDTDFCALPMYECEENARIFRSPPV